MRCTVELLGVARLRAEQRAVEVRLGERRGDRGERGAACAATVADALAALAAACPVLVGPVLTPDGRSLCTGYLLNRNGREFVDRTDTLLADGDRLLLISSAAGGDRWGPPLYHPSYPPTEAQVLPARAGTAEPAAAAPQVERVPEGAA